MPKDELEHVAHPHIVLGELVLGENADELGDRIAHRLLRLVDHRLQHTVLDDGLLVNGYLFPVAQLAESLAQQNGGVLPDLQVLGGDDNFAERRNGIGMLRGLVQFSGRLEGCKKVCIR